jgi:hypothetical protein
VRYGRSKQRDFRDGTHKMFHCPALMATASGIVTVSLKILVYETLICKQFYFMTYAFQVQRFCDVQSGYAAIIQDVPISLSTTKPGEMVLPDQFLRLQISASEILVPILCSGLRPLVEKDVFSALQQIMRPLQEVPHY